MNSFVRRDIVVSAVVIGVGGLLLGSAAAVDTAAPAAEPDRVGFYQREILVSSDDAAVVGFLAPEGWYTDALDDSSAEYSSADGDARLELVLVEDVGDDVAAALEEVTDPAVTGATAATTASGLPLGAGELPRSDGERERAYLVLSAGGGEGDDGVPTGELGLLVTVEYLRGDEERMRADVGALLGSVEITR
ncbi:hypothetical protein SCB71_02815 [Herbiconiux sp. KACC 21604]|uniref:hypothetical protein n=1 Tax=unclassified Herbiconiux TaxID=2618217 RepID=UPI001490D7D3|nr:hypothetical protein [Herbiconiux sp. SALV-R1]QJU52332.1 hypothetical protein HL652_00785 [Herbiconiux sp. SALV-R1]WPO87188.1 hypothetical protein SCB71_02815 [Herbiconiux sp. KACC 21604]